VLPPFLICPSHQWFSCSFPIVLPSFSSSGLMVSAGPGRPRGSGDFFGASLSFLRASVAAMAAHFIGDVFFRRHVRIRRLDDSELCNNTQQINNINEKRGGGPEPEPEPSTEPPLESVLIYGRFSHTLTWGKGRGGTRHDLVLIFLQRVNRQR
jgi:hypothetical protein